ncbi:MAG: DedA family protein [Firmicutes bacterium]|nr:DedA family protein [Bacillota bacterium]
MESFIVSHGYLALVVLAFIEACCIPIPSEVTFGFAGALAGGLLHKPGDPHLNIVAVILLGTVAEVLGSFVSYAVGKAGGRPFVYKFGKYVLISKSDIDRTDQFFAKHGDIAVPIGRAMPLIRTFVSLAAGIAEMSFWRFTLFTALGTLVYSAVLAGLGYAVGSAWHSVANGFQYAAYVLLVVVVVAVAIFVYHRLQVLKKDKMAESKTI